MRQDISRTRLRAIESSLENGQAWVPPSPSHRKTWEEEVILGVLIFLDSALVCVNMRDRSLLPNMLLAFLPL